MLNKRIVDIMIGFIKLRAYQICLLVLLLTFSSIKLHAHPHNWITLKTEFILDDSGKLTELVQHWTFDVYYSAINLSDIANLKGSQQEGLRKTAEVMVKNLKGYDYFSELNIDNQSVNLSKPKDYSLAITSSSDGQQQLLLSMRFELDRKKLIKKKNVTWRVFDPTYYIDMRHETRSQVVIHKANNTKCTTNIESPTPSPEIIEYALNLDRSMKETKGLGDHFADRILIQCQ